MYTVETRYLRYKNGRVTIRNVSTSRCPDARKFRNYAPRRQQKKTGNNKKRESIVRGTIGRQLWRGVRLKGDVLR